MTTYQIVDVPLPYHPNIITVSRDPAADAIAAIPDMVAWFDPAPRFITGADATSFRLRDKRWGRNMIAPFSRRPEETASTNGRPMLGVGRGTLGTTGTDNGAFQIDDAGITPTGEYSFIFPWRNDIIASGTMVALHDATQFFTIGLTSSSTSSTSLSVSPARTASAGEALETVAGSYRDRTFVMGVFYSNDRWRIMVNDSVIYERAFAPDPTGYKLRIGGRSSNSNASPAGIGGSVGDILAFSRDISVPGRRADCTAVMQYLMGKFGITA